QQAGYTQTTETEEDLGQASFTTTIRQCSSGRSDNRPSSPATMHTADSLLLQGAISALVLQNVSAWWLWGETGIPDEVPPLNFSVLVGEEAGREWLQG
ncbi:unnamed protein product, partial [Ectocarpus sp. 12 AP-2014]